MNGKHLNMKMVFNKNVLVSNSKQVFYKKLPNITVNQLKKRRNSLIADIKQFENERNSLIADIKQFENYLNSLNKYLNVVDVDVIQLKGDRNFIMLSIKLLEGEKNILDVKIQQLYETIKLLEINIELLVSNKNMVRLRKKIVGVGEYIWRVYISKEFKYIEMAMLFLIISRPFFNACSLVLSPQLNVLTSILTIIYLSFVILILILTGKNITDGRSILYETNSISYITKLLKIVLSIYSIYHLSLSNITLSFDLLLNVGALA
jgi:hypothetical protein